MTGSPFDTHVTGRAWDTPAAAFDVDEESFLIGIEITDMEGRLPEPVIGVFTICGHQGTKAFLSLDQAVSVASQLTTAVQMVLGGARSLEKN